MAKKLKIKMPAGPQTREEVEIVLLNICMATSRMSELTALMDQRLAAVRAEYADGLTGLDNFIKAQMAEAKSWADRNPQEFAGKASISMAHGIVGYRTGMPTLKLLSKHTWKQALEYLEENYPQYVRVDPSVNKEQIIADRAILAKKDEIKTMGLKINQERRFFVEPTVTDPNEVRHGDS